MTTFATSSIPLSPRAKPAAKRSNKTAIIAGSVIGGVVLICLFVCVIIPFLLRRRRRRREGQINEGPRVLRRRGQPSGSDGTSPLLVQSFTGQRSIDAQDGHERKPSDATPLMQFAHDSGHDPEADAYTNADNTTRNISPPMPLKALKQRELSTDTVTSRESSYSQASVLARKYRDIGNSSGTPQASALPPRLPSIRRTAPLSNIYELPQATTWNSAATDKNDGMGSTWSEHADQQPLSTPRPGRRGSLSARTVLPNVPMEALMESEGSGSSLPIDKNDQGNGRERWSSAADPGGSHPRSHHLPTPPNSHPNSARPASPSYLSRNSPVGFGFGLSTLTSAFRKSVSASSISSVYEPSDPHGPLNHYPSVASIGATSGTGTYHTAQSDAGGTRFSGSEGTAAAMGMVNASRPRTKGPRPQTTSRASLSTYPSSSSLPSASSSSNPPPPVPLIPPPPAIHPLPQTQGPDPLNPYRPQPPHPEMTMQDPHARAHVRSPLAHRIRADPHPQVSLARAGRSTHGIIDLIEQ